MIWAAVVFGTLAFWSLGMWILIRRDEGRWPWKTPCHCHTDVMFGRFTEDCERHGPG